MLTIDNFPDLFDHWLVITCTSSKYFQPSGLGRNPPGQADGQRSKEKKRKTKRPVGRPHLSVRAGDGDRHPQIPPLPVSEFGLCSTKSLANGVLIPPPPLHCTRPYKIPCHRIIHSSRPYRVGSPPTSPPLLASLASDPRRPPANPLSSPNPSPALGGSPSSSAARRVRHFHRRYCCCCLCFCFCCCVGGFRSVGCRGDLDSARAGGVILCGHLFVMTGWWYCWVRAGDRSSGGGGRGWAAWIGEGSEWMSRRSVNPSRRVADGGLPSVGGLLHPKSRSPPVLTIALVVLVVFIFLFVNLVVRISHVLSWQKYACVFFFFGFQGVIILIAYFNSGSGQLELHLNILLHLFIFVPFSLYCKMVKRP